MIFLIITAALLPFVDKSKNVGFNKTWTYFDTQHASSFRFSTSDFLYQNVSKHLFLFFSNVCVSRICSVLRSVGKGVVGRIV